METADTTCALSGSISGAGKSSEIRLRMCGPPLWFLAAAARMSLASSSGDRLGSVSGAGALRVVSWTGASFARGKWSGIGNLLKKFGGIIDFTGSDLAEGQLGNGLCKALRELINQLIPTATCS